LLNNNINYNLKFYFEIEMIFEYIILE
jgi:hypothetical protein